MTAPAPKSDAYWADINQMISTWPEWTDEQIKAINAVLWVNHPNCQPAERRLGRAS